MSYEFRETDGFYFWQRLESAATIEGEHEVTKALARIYAALAPLEKDCAAYEASDSNWDRPCRGAMRHLRSIEDAVTGLRQLADCYETLVNAVLRERDPR